MKNQKLNMTYKIFFQTKNLSKFNSLKDTIWQYATVFYFWWKLEFYVQIVEK